MAQVELTRREWLLAAGALSSGCATRRSGPRGYPGGFQGPSPQRGHLLREGRGREGAVGDDPPVAVAILGGGAAGLSAAWALSRAGVDDYVMLELEDQPGGTARGEVARSGGTTITRHPLGAHYLPVPSQSMRAVCTLLQELGVLQGFDAAGRARCVEEHLCRAPQERVFYKGRWHEGLYLRAGASPDDLRQLDQYHEEVGRWVRARDGAGRRVFSVGEAPQGDRRAAGAAMLDGRTMAQHLDSLGLRSWRLRWLVDYGCRDDFGVNLGQTSAWAAIHYFAARLMHPDDHPPEVLTWPEGNGFLVARLAEKIGAARVRGGCLVSDVRPAGSEVEVRYLRGTEAEPRRLRARHVIFALPTFQRRHLLAELRAAPPKYLDAFTYAPWLVANLLLRRAVSPPVAGGMPVPGGPRPVPGYPTCWDNVLVESPGLGYVVATHQREAALPSDGVPRTVFTYYRPLCGSYHERRSGAAVDPRAERQRLLSADHVTLSAEVLQDLARAEPTLLEELERIDLCRWGHGMVRPVPGLMTGEALEKARAPLGAVHFAHSDLSGLALFEEAQAAGVRAAQEVLAERGHPFESLL